MWGLIGVWILGLVALTVIATEIKGTDHNVAFAIGGIWYTFIIFVLLGVIFFARGVRPYMITDREINLIGLNGTFVKRAELELGLKPEIKNREPNLPPKQGVD
ncbi:MAG TPA: hypothetical protein VGJ05_10535 [Fimbriiglobus sp.]